MDGLQLHAPGLKQIVCVQILQRRGTTVAYKILDMEKAIYNSRITHSEKFNVFIPLYKFTNLQYYSLNNTNFM